jgi:hypothetical protein
VIPSKSRLSIINHHHPNQLTSRLVHPPPHPARVLVTSTLVTHGAENILCKKALTTLFLDSQFGKCDLTKHHDFARQSISRIPHDTI